MSGTVNGHVVESDGEDDEISTIHKTSQTIAYRSFPPTMKIYYQWNLIGLKTFYVCGENESDRLFAVKVHTGYSLSGPLGVRPGLHLFNGPSTDDPMLAATGEDGLGGWLNYDSHIFLPAKDYKWSSRVGVSGLVDETMHVHTTPKPDNNVSFRFSIEVECGKKRPSRKTFEWRRIKRSERDEDTQKGGFKLSRLDPTDTQEEMSGGRGSTSDGVGNSGQRAGSATDREVLAVFSWRRFITSPKHPFDLELMGSGRTGEMGERWTLMVLLTAIRLWWMHTSGKTHRTPVAIAQKITGKGKDAA